jgi:hypothetical protein
MDDPNNTRILPSQVMDWYPHGIYLIPEGGAPAPAKKGLARKRYLALSREAVAGETLELLTGIIQACKIDLGDLHILQWDNKEGYVSLIEKTGSVFVLLFGVEPADIDLPLVFPHFQTQTFAGATWVASPDLHILQNDRLMKSKLWLCLKQAFSI